MCNGACKVPTATVCRVRLGNVATAVLLLAHVPPATRSLKPDVVLTHMFVEPMMGEGEVFMVTVAVALQPAASV